MGLKGAGDRQGNTDDGCTPGGRGDRSIVAVGWAVAGALVDAGFDVVGTSRDTTGATAPGGVMLLALDVGSDESVAGFVDDVIARFGRIDTGQQRRCGAVAPRRRAPSRRPRGCSTCAFSAWSG